MPNKRKDGCGEKFEFRDFSLTLNKFFCSINGERDDLQLSDFRMLKVIVNK